MSVHEDWFVQSFVVHNCLTRGASKEVLAGTEIPGSRGGETSYSQRYTAARLV